MLLGQVTLPQVMAMVNKCLVYLDLLCLGLLDLLVLLEQVTLPQVITMVNKCLVFLDLIVGLVRCLK